MRCIVCGRELSNPRSVRKGMGPVCRHRCLAVVELREIRRKALDYEKVARAALEGVSVEEVGAWSF